MPDSEYSWDWRRNLPPVPSMSLFSGLGVAPTNKPWGETTPDNAMPAPAMNTGPGYTPNITAPGNPGVTMPSGMPFGSMGNPDARSAEVAAQAVANKPKTYEERLLEALKNKDFMGGLAAIAKGTGYGGTKVTSHPFHVSAASMGPGLPDHRGQGSAFMAKALADMASPDKDLTIPIQRKSARGAQARYDILAQRQKQDLSELYKNLV
jgi:hypothetical protein